MREIKTKPEGGSPKLLKRAAKMPKAAMKDIWLKATEKTVSEVKETPFDSLRDESTNAPANNGGEQMVSGIETAVKKGTDMAGRVGETVASTAARKVKKARETARAAKGLQEARNTTEEAARFTSAPEKIRMKPTAVKAVRGKPTKAVKTASRSMRGVKQGAKSIKIAQTVAKRTRQAAQGIRAGDPAGAAGGQSSGAYDPRRRPCDRCGSEGHRCGGQGVSRRHRRRRLGGSIDYPDCLPCSHAVWLRFRCRQRSKPYRMSSRKSRKIFQSWRDNWVNLSTYLEVLRLIYITTPLKASTASRAR